MLHQLEIRALVLKVRLGWEAVERKVPQDVSFSVSLRFDRMPEGCRTDELSDSLCYGDVSELIARNIESREFKLIEHLAFVLFEEIKKLAGASVRVRLEVHKLHPPVENLRGGSVYTIGDF